MTNEEMELAGYSRVFDYTQYSHENNINVIPEEAFKRLVSDTFKTISDVLRSTYGPYGSSVIISEQSETTTTKDGYNVFQSMGFNHAYKRMVYLAIQKIIDRVNRNVGDGTTSCILLADKIFNNLNDIIKTPDDKRNILDILLFIEKKLQDKDLLAKGRELKDIEPLTRYALQQIISLSSNYDYELTSVIVEALQPEVDPNTGEVLSVRNVITNEDVSLDADSNATYSFEYMPGDYRVRVNIGVEEANKLANPAQIRCAIYDHAFGSTDWINFTQDYDGYPTIILARTFTRGFLSNEWVLHLKQLQMAKKCGKSDGVNNIYLAEVQGTYVQHEIQDLAHLLGTKAFDIHAGVVDHAELPMVIVSVFKGNCLAFYEVGDEYVDQYINTLKAELDADTTHSYLKEKEYNDRIKALKMETKDTMLTVKCGSTLEAKLITDKIDDCISIVNSAITSGIVPNLLKYAYTRMRQMRSFANETHGDLDAVINAIELSIEGLFDDIWQSKYGDKCNYSRDKQRSDHYSNGKFTSFDIICNASLPGQKLPTSAQYDLEVVAASLSIVKYLLTSRALVFDAHILPAVNDEGHYTRQ